MDLTVVIVVMGASLLLLLGPLLIIAKFYRRVGQGKVLVINRSQGEPQVSFNAALVIPGLQSAEVMDISLKTLEIQRRGRESLRARDGVRVDMTATFYVRVNQTREDILVVARTVGCARAGEPETLKMLFERRFLEALETVIARYDAQDLRSHREQFKDEVIKVIGRDLNGYVLDNCVIHELASVPAVN